MIQASRDQLVTAAWLSVGAFCLCVACFIPPLSARFIGSPLWVVVLALGIAVSAVLHLVFVGLLARHLGRRASLAVALALVTLPVGSIVGLVLLEWQGRIGAAQPTGRSA